MYTVYLLRYTLYKSKTYNGTDYKCLSPATGELLEELEVSRFRNPRRPLIGCLHHLRAEQSKTVVSGGERLPRGNSYDT